MTRRVPEVSVEDDDILCYGDAPDRGGSSRAAINVDVDVEDENIADVDASTSDTLFAGSVPIRTPPLPINITSLHSRSSLEPPQRSAKSAMIRGIEYNLGDAVELLHPQGRHRAGDFLRIHHIASRPGLGNCRLRGLLMRRQCNSNGFLDPRLNELYIVLQTTPEHQGHDLEQGVVEVGPGQVLCKREIVLTNVLVSPLGRPHPDLSFRANPLSNGEKDGVRENQVLVCRWASVICASSEQLRRGKAQHETIRRLQESELRLLKQKFPGTGSVRPCQDSLLTSQWRGQLLITTSNGGHTTVDCFCASGQVSEAFSEAAFRILCGFDICPDAIDTYAANRSPSTISLNCSVDEFASVAEAYVCDHLHISFVCKTHSSMHTIIGKDDDANEATLFSTDELVKKMRPRIVTVENVAGLVTHNKHKMMFQKAVNSLTSLDYSVTWTLIDMRDYGLAARRLRLIMVATCPGTAPPAFPNATHGPPGSGLLPFNTIGNVLASIPTHATHQGPKYFKTLNRPPYDDFRTINCITTSGGDPGVNYHPSGTRTLNVRELASLNEFRSDFVLPENGRKAREMIGNAVPRLVFRQFAVVIKQYLTKQDAWLARERARVFRVD